MAVRRAASPSRSPSAGDRRKRSRSAASDKTVTVARRRRETRRSSSEESQRELRRIATDGAAGSPRARRSRSLKGATRARETTIKVVAPAEAGRTRDMRSTQPLIRESSDKDLEQVQCKMWQLLPRAGSIRPTVRSAWLTGTGTRGSSRGTNA